MIANSCQKYTALIIESSPENSHFLANSINFLFPDVVILAVAENLQSTREILLNYAVDLVFTNIAIIGETQLLLKGRNLPGFVLLSETIEDAKCALRNNMCGFISIPFDQNDISISVRSAFDKIDQRRNQQRERQVNYLAHKKLVGVPTMEGIEFLDTDTIIRCEGLQKCTLIVTTEKSDIISSYNLGKFKDLLGGHGFFSCHRSHHINLKFVKKYSREGYIFFNADSKPVPLARRRKCDFLSQIRHL